VGAASVSHVVPICCFFLMKKYNKFTSFQKSSTFFLSENCSFAVFLGFFFRKKVRNCFLTRAATNGTISNHMVPTTADQIMPV